MRAAEQKSAATTAAKGNTSFFNKGSSTVLSSESDTEQPFFVKSSEPAVQARFESDPIPGSGDALSSFINPAPATIQAKCDQCEKEEEKVQQKELQDGVSIQEKLSIGEPGDPYEKEADAVADKVVQKLSEPGENNAVRDKNNSVQLKCSTCDGAALAGGEAGKTKEEEDVQDSAPEISRMVIEDMAPPPADTPADNGADNNGSGNSIKSNTGRTEQVQRRCRECDEGDKVFLKLMNTVQLSSDSSGAKGTREAVVAAAKSQIGKVEAKHADSGGKRVGAKYLLEYFHKAAPGVWDDSIIETAGAKMPSWCGIFSVWAHKQAGLDIGNWQMGKGVSAFGKLKNTTSPQPGDIGYIHDPNQHHCIVVKVEGGNVHSIDGNSGLFSEVKENIRPLKAYDVFLTAFSGGTSVQRKEDEDKKAIQGKSDIATDTAPASVESKLSSSKGNGDSLPGEVRNNMEDHIGADFSNVKIHTGTEAEQMSKDLHAQAFTHGSDIYFNSGKYDTQSKSGQHLLAHELTHTVQQGAALQRKETPEVQRAPVTEEQKQKIKDSLAALGVKVDDVDIQAIQDQFPDGFTPERMTDFIQVSGENYSNIARMSFVRLGPTVPVAVQVELFIFEVGKGRSILVSSVGGGGSILLDAGAGGAKTSNSTAARTLATHINNIASAGLTAFPTMIKVSHVDADHYNAVSSVLNLPQMGTAVVEVTRQQLNQAIRSGVWTTMNVQISPSQSIVQLNVTGTGINVQRSIIGNMELTEFRSEAAHGALTAPGQSSYNKNNTSPVTIVRDIVSNTTYVMTGDAEGRLLNDVVNMVGEDAFRRIAGGGKRNLAGVEYPHHGGMVKRGPDVTGMVRFLRLMFESSNGSINFFAQTSQTFSTSPSASIRYLDTAEIPVERIMEDPAGSTGVRRMRGTANSRIMMNGNQIGQVIALGNTNSSRVMEAYQMRDRILNATELTQLMERAFSAAPGNAQTLAGALGTAKTGIETHNTTLETRLNAFWAELANTAQQPASGGMRAQANTLMLQTEVGNLGTAVAAMGTNIDALENSLTEIRNGMSLINRVFLNSLSLQQALRYRDMASLNALKGEQRALLNEMLLDARIELGKGEFDQQVRGAWKAVRGQWNARYVQRIATRMGMSEASTKQMLFRGVLARNLTRQMQLNDLARRAQEGQLPRAGGGAAPMKTRVGAGFMAAIELLRIGLEFYESWEAAEIADAQREREKKIQGLREVYWWIDLGVRPDIRLVESSWGSLEVLEDVSSEQAYKIINEEVPEEERPEYDRVVVYDIAPEDLKTVVAQFYLRYMTLADWIGDMGDPELNDRMTVGSSDRWFVKSFYGWRVKLWSNEDGKYGLFHAPVIQQPLNDLMVHLNASQQEEFDRLKEEHGAEGTKTVSDSALVFGTDRIAYVYNSYGGAEELDFDDFKPTFVKLYKVSYPYRMGGEKMLVRAADAETYRKLTRYYWIKESDQEYMEANGMVHRNYYVINNPSGYAYVDEDDLEQKDEPTIQKKEIGDEMPGEQQEEQNSPAAVKPASSSFLVDDAVVPEEGQMRRAVFLEKLKSGICDSVNQALAGTTFTADSCPYLQAAFAKHENSSPEQLEALINRYAPDTKNASNAEDMISRMKAKAYTTTLEWVSSGADLSQTPALLSGIATGDGSGIGGMIAGAGQLLFKADTGGAHASQSPKAVMQSLGKGSPMESTTRSKMESAFGTSFSNVQIHADSNAAQLSKGMNARAFTVGNHIAFGGGEYGSGSLAGDALLAHELAHTIQQSGTTDNERPGSTESELENAADASALSVMMKMNEGKEKKSGKEFRTGLKLQRCIDCGGSKDPMEELFKSFEGMDDPGEIADNLKDLDDEKLKKVKAKAGKMPLIAEAVKWEEAYRKMQWSTLLKLHRAGSQPFYKSYKERIMQLITDGQVNIKITGSETFISYIKEQLDDLMGLPTGFRLILELLVTGKEVELKETKGDDATQVKGDDLDAGRLVTTDDTGKPLPLNKQHASAGVGSTISINPEHANNQSVLSGSAGSLSTINMDPDITVGHELIHALHSAQGTNLRPPSMTAVTRALGGSNYFVKDDATGATVSPEEIRTISGQTKFNAPTEGVNGTADWPLEFNLSDQITENQLRKEKGLPARAGHLGTLTSVTKKMVKGETVDHLLSAYQLNDGKPVPGNIQVVIKDQFKVLNPYFDGHDALPETIDEFPARLPDTHFISMHLRFVLNRPADADIADKLIIK